jgi:hypothetical protein
MPKLMMSHRDKGDIGWIRYLESSSVQLVGACQRFHGILVLPDAILCHAERIQKSPIMPV